MNDFLFYTKLGLTHILDSNAYDHLLFLVILSLPFLYKQLKQLVLLITAFTVGHTLALWAASYGVISVSTSWIELLIPVTILLTTLHVLYWNSSIRTKSTMAFTVLTVFFGIIHGLGFSSYFTTPWKWQN